MTTEQGNQMTTEQGNQMTTEQGNQLRTEQGNQMTTEQGNQFSSECPIHYVLYTMFFRFHLPPATKYVQPQVYQ